MYHSGIRSVRNAFAFVITVIIYSSSLSLHAFVITVIIYSSSLSLYRDAWA